MLLMAGKTDVMGEFEVVRCLRHVGYWAKVNDKTLMLLDLRSLRYVDKLNGSVDTGIKMVNLFSIIRGHTVTSLSRHDILSHAQSTREYQHGPKQHTGPTSRC